MSEEKSGQSREKDLKIGLWGASSSGKTTYLAALGIAILGWDRSLGEWQIRPGNEESQEFLGYENPLLKRALPSPSQGGTSYQWNISGTMYELPPPPTRGRRRYVPAKVQRHISFSLEVLDVPGAWLEKSEVLFDEQQKMLDEHFAACDGLVYLYDPLAKPDDQFGAQAFSLVQRLIAQFKDVKSGRLRQHIAVCVTKFDDPRVFGPAVRGGWVTQRTSSTLPLPSDTKGYFESIAPRLVANTFHNYFQPERTRYYVTSSVGFNPDRNGYLDEENSANVREEDGDFFTIGEAQPIHVLEPLIWLEQQCRLDRGAR